MFFKQGCRKRGAEGAWVPPVFGRTVNPTSTRGADYTHHRTTSPSGFSDLATVLLSVRKNKKVFLLSVHFASYYSQQDWGIWTLKLELLNEIQNRRLILFWSLDQVGMFFEKFKSSFELVDASPTKRQLIKFKYSEKATKIWPIFHS